MMLVLASASAARANLLEAAGVPFHIAPAEIDEAPVKAGGGGARDIALELACRKALAVGARFPDDVVLGADQVLEFEGRIVSKSRDRGELAVLMKMLRGRGHALLTGAALVRDGRVLWRHVDEARLVMRAFSDRFLEKYLVRGGDALLSSVGGYRLEGAGAQLFDRIEGDYFSILGLPLLPVLNALRELGILES